MGKTRRWTDLNFKVDAEFHRRFIVAAAEAGSTGKGLFEVMFARYMSDQSGCAFVRLNPPVIGTGSEPDEAASGASDDLTVSRHQDATGDASTAYDGGTQLTVTSRIGSLKSWMRSCLDHWLTAECRNS